MKIINSQILWHHSDTGETRSWFMDGNKIAGQATVLGEDGKPAFVGPPFHIVGTGDFNGDETADIVWYHSQTGETRIWFMDGHKIASQATVLGEDGKAALVGPPFSIVGIADMSGDGKSDIIWYHSQTGETRIWFMDGHRIANQATVLGEDGKAALVGPPFSIVGVGDMNGDGKSDIVWYHSQTGETRIWFMDGHRIAGQATVLGEDGKAALVGPPFSIVGVGDMNGDGKSDLVWYHSQTGETRIWFMDGHRIASQATVLAENGNPAIVGPPFSIVASGVARKIQEVSLRYVGFHCFGETDELSASDEPYFLFGVVPTCVELKKTEMTKVYTDVDAGESRGDFIELYRGLALGGAFSITLAEHDHGDPNKFRDNVDKAVDAAAAEAVKGLAAIPVVGAPLAVLGQIAFIVIGPAITDAVNKLIGTGDDLIGSVRLTLSPADMLRLCRTGHQDFHGIKANLESPLISGDGSSYKAYFDIVEV